MEKCLVYSEDLEFAVCEWVSISIQDGITTYEDLSNGIALIKLLNKIDPASFDLAKVTKLKEETEDDEDEEAFGWANLQLLDESIMMAWQENIEKTIQDLVSCDLLEIVKSNDRQEMHKLAVTVIITVIMLSKQDKAYSILKNIYSIADMTLQTKIKELIERLVAVFTEFTGLANENDPTSEPLTPFKTEEPPSQLARPENVINNSAALVDEFQKVNSNLAKLKKENKQKTNKIVDLEKENQILKDQITSKNVEVEKLKFELKNIKEIADMNKADILELELNQSRSQVESLKARLEEKQKEYNLKLARYQEQYEEYRGRIRELEEYRTKYDEIVLKESAGEQMNDDELRAEYEKLKNELQRETERMNKMQDDAIKDKDSLTKLELKLADLESENLNKDMRVQELDMKKNNLQIQVDKLKEFKDAQSNLSVEDKVTQIYGLIASEESQNTQTEMLQKIASNFSTLNFRTGPAQAEEELQDKGKLKKMVLELRKKNIELKRRVKEIGETLLKNNPNPTKEQLEQINQEEGAKSTSSMFAQQLLQKVILYEQLNTQLKYEKKQLMESKLKNDARSLESLNIMYSILADSVLGTSQA